MPNLHIKMPLQNESSSILKIVLEPLSEYFLIRPGQSIEIHGICDDKTNNVFFTIAPNDTFLIVYAPGEISGFVDCYVTCGETRLIPDGN